MNSVGRLGLSWTQAAALMRVHTLRRVLPENSGADGFWVGQQRARTFSNPCSIDVMAVGRTREQVALTSFS